MGGTLLFTLGCGDGAKNRTRPLSGGFFVEKYCNVIGNKGKVDKESWGKAGHSLKYSIEVKNTASDARLNRFESQLLFDFGKVT